MFHDFHPPRIPLSDMVPSLCLPKMPQSSRSAPPVAFSSVFYNLGVRSSFLSKLYHHCCLHLYFLCRISYTYLCPTPSLGSEALAIARARVPTAQSRRAARAPHTDQLGSALCLAYAVALIRAYARASPGSHRCSTAGFASSIAGSLSPCH